MTEDALRAALKPFAEKAKRFASPRYDVLKGVQQKVTFTIAEMRAIAEAYTALESATQPAVGDGWNAPLMEKIKDRFSAASMDANMHENPTVRKNAHCEMEFLQEVLSALTAHLPASPTIPERLTDGFVRGLEAAAKCAENHPVGLESQRFGDDWASGEACAARDIAAAIRALSPAPPLPPASKRKIRK